MIHVNRNEDITKNLNTMICQMVEMNVTKKVGGPFRASKNSALDPASMIYKLIKQPGLVSCNRNFSNAIDFINCLEKPPASESVEIDPSTVIASKIFCDESFFCPNVEKSNLTLDFASDAESQCSRIMEKTFIPRNLSGEQNLGLTSKNDEETIDVMAINQISPEKCINVVNESGERNDRIEVPENNDGSSVNLARLSETDVSTSIVERQNNKTASKSESTQTERSLIIRTARSCPSHGKRVRLNFLMKINRRPKFQDPLFIYRKSSDHLILEKGKASHSPAYVANFERFRWKYLTSRK